jgi:hypothetical protein
MHVQLLQHLPAHMHVHIGQMHRDTLSDTNRERQIADALPRIFDRPGQSPVVEPGQTPVLKPC